MNNFFPFNANTLLIGVIVGALYVLASWSAERDMAVCQLSHSFDICHKTLLP